MKATNYDYNVSGGSADTVATLEDGRTAWINTQWGTANVRHAPECAISKQTACYPKAVCDCGAELNAADTYALVADARTNGKFGPQPSRDENESTQREIARPARTGLCPECGTYCCGDCNA